MTHRPRIALITNHGYGAPVIPAGGAPDTGGQNVYVNTLASRMERLGYAVTVFARGGFPHFDDTRPRDGVEQASAGVRYVYIPGGGDRFILKEEIAIALDEQVEWLDAFVRREAAEQGCEPWELYEFVNTHYWDAAVLGTRLVERWRNDIVDIALRRLLADVVPDDLLDRTHAERHWLALGEMPASYLGKLLLEAHDGDAPLETSVRDAAAAWSTARALDASVATAITETVLAGVAAHPDADPQVQRPIAAAAIGAAAFALDPEIAQELGRDLDRVDRHVWTPHSLSDLKDYNYRDRPLEQRRALRFCERRDHERMICARTPAFASTSAEIAEQLWTRYRVPVERTFYFPPCIDGDVFRPYTEQELAPTYDYLSRISEVPAERLIRSLIVFETSRMDRTKRKDLLLEAFARLVPRHDGVYLFIGGGPENDVFQDLQTQLDGEERLRGRAFLTRAIPDENIGPMFSVAGIYASASEMEGFGMSVAQAAAAGTPIVSADTIPFSVALASDDALLFPAGDAGKMAAAIERLIEEPDDRKVRGQRLIEIARTLDWEEKTRRLIDYLRGRGMNVREGQPA